MTRCAVKITRKYFVESLRIVPSKPIIPNCLVHRPARYSMTENASKSSKSGVGVTIWRYNYECLTVYQRSSSIN